MSSPPTQDHFPYTLGIFKPDISRDTDAVLDIMCQVADAGLCAVNNDCKIVQLPRATAEQLYAEHKGKPFYEGLIDFMTSGPVYVLALAFLEGGAPVTTWREIVSYARRKYAIPGGPRNALHGSDSTESARREIAIFFTSSENPNELRPEVKRSFLNNPVSA